MIKKISIYIPSERMRTMLVDFLDGRFSLRHFSQELTLEASDGYDDSSDRCQVQVPSDPRCETEDDSDLGDHGDDNRDRYDRFTIADDKHQRHRNDGEQSDEECVRDKARSEDRTDAVALDDIELHR